MHVAVIGSGISGLAAAYFLSRQHRVTLFEREARLGGHTHTILVDGPAGPIPLDTGFIVHNEQTYPGLVRLFAELGLESMPTDMSFSVRCPSTGFAYSSRGAAGFFASPRNLVRPGHYRLLRDVLRFNRKAPLVLDDHGSHSGPRNDETLGEYVRRERYGPEFLPRYLAPMASAVWSSSVEDVGRFPLRPLVRFLRNHGMLSVGAHPTWRVLRGGSHVYIPGLTAPLGHGAVQTGVHLRSVVRRATSVRLTFDNRPAEEVDHVVFACHGDQVLPLLADATCRERDVLSAFSSTANDVWLHTDHRHLPVSPRLGAAWNYQLGSEPGTPPTVTYDLNRLQRLTEVTRYCVTLNPRSPIDEASVIRRLSYRHPRVTAASVLAQDRWLEISGVDRVHFCGAYWGYGFHEDGLQSARRVAAALGAPW